MSVDIERRTLFPAETLARLVPEVPVEQLVEALDILAQLGLIWRAESGPDIRYAYRAASASQTPETDENDHEAASIISTPYGGAQHPEGHHA